MRGDKVTVTITEAEDSSVNISFEFDPPPSPEGKSVRGVALAIMMDAIQDGLGKPTEVEIVHADPA